MLTGHNGQEGRRRESGEGDSPSTAYLANSPHEVGTTTFMKSVR